MTPGLFSFSGIASLTIFFICAHIVTELFLHYVIKVKNSIFLRAFIVAILFLIINPFLMRKTGEQNKVEEQIQTEQHVDRPKINIEAVLHALEKHQVNNLLPNIDLITSWGSLQFIDGALAQLTLKHIGQRVLANPIDIIQKSSKLPAFVLCYNNNLLVNWLLICQKETANTIELIYETVYANNLIYKHFVIDKHVYKIDLTIELIPEEKQEDSNHLAVLLPAPLSFDKASREASEVSLFDEQSAILIGTNGKFEKLNRDVLGAQEPWQQPSLFGVDNRYFVHALTHDHDNFVQNAWYFSDAHHRKSLVAVLQHNVLKDEQQSWHLSFYCGPKQMQAFEQVDKRLDGSLGYWWVFASLCKFFLHVLNWLYAYVHNYGLAIIIFTIVARLIFLPFTFGYDELEERKKRTLHAKKLAYIRQKYKDDREALMREQSEFFRKEGLGLGMGIWVTFLQLPIFITISRLLSNAIEMHGAPMLWIPDLSAADPYYILPLLMFIMIIAKGVLATQTNDGIGALVTTFVIALFFSGFATYMSAGLALYLLTSIIVEMMQTLVTRSFKKASNKKATESCVA